MAMKQIQEKGRRKINEMKQQKLTAKMKDMAEIGGGCQKMSEDI